MDISALMDEANSFSENAGKAGTQLFNLNIDSAAVESNTASLMTALGTNSQIIDSAKQNADLATQNARIKGANALGTNLKAQGEVITGLSSDVLSLMNQKQVLAKTIADKQSVGLFDDPLQHVINLFTINDDINKHNAVNEQLVSDQEQITKLNSMTQSIATTQNALNEPITAAAIDASAKNTAATAQINANKSTLEALKYNGAGITAALSAGKEALGAQFNALTAANSQQNIQIALDHLSLERQRFSWQQDEKRISDEARAKNTSTDDYILSQVNDGLQRMGQQPIPITSPKAGNIVSLIKSNSPAAQTYVEAMLISQQSERAGGTTILAPNPARAAELLNANLIKTTSAQSQVVDILQTAATQVKAAGQAGTINLKDKSATDEAMKASSTQILSAYAKRINPGDPSNPFQIPALGALINAAPELQTLPVVSKVIAPAIAAGNDMSDPAKVYATAIAAINAGTITVPEAVEGLAYTYQRGVKVNLEARQFQSLGLNLNPKKPGDPSMMTYNAPISVGSTLGFSNKQVVDMTDMVAISRAINKSLANQAFNAAQTTGFLP